MTLRSNDYPVEVIRAYSYLFIIICILYNNFRQRRQSGFKSGVVDPGQQNFNFPRQISEKFRFVQGISPKYLFSRQILLIYSYSWENYSISLQKSPLSNMPPVHYTIYFKTRPHTPTAPCDPTIPCQKSGRSRLPQPPQD